MRKMLSALSLILLSIILFTGCQERENSTGETDQTARLSALRTPYVGTAWAVSEIVQRLPVPAHDWRQRFFSIGNDYGSGLAPYTLTVYYEPIDLRVATAMQAREMPYRAFAENATMLFALVDNLQKISFAVRQTPGGNELERDAYEYRWSITRACIVALLGLDGWNDLWRENGVMLAMDVLEAIYKNEQQLPSFGAYGNARQ